MMSILNLVIFFLILVKIDTINSSSPCKGNRYCTCRVPSLGEINIACRVQEKLSLRMNYKPYDTLKITCKNWNEWAYFNLTENLPVKTLNSLQFHNCGLSQEISLKSFVAQFGMEETKSLFFKSYNKIYETLKRKNLQGFPRVKKLILSQNGFTEISNDCFKDFPELEWLDLSENYLILPVNIFNATPNLKGIVLSFNKIEIIQFGLFDGLKKLESLSLEGNELTEIKDGTFDNLISLKTLDLSDNKLLELPQNIFHKLIQLKDLDLSFNNLSYVLSDQFKENTKLEKLMLHNSVKNMSILPDSLLANLTKLQKIELCVNGLTVLPENTFWDSTLLKNIYLDDNFLVTLPRNIFKDLRDLIVLEISNNEIESLPNQIFEDLKKLKTLNLSKNKMIYISKNLFAGLFQLNVLNMESNQLKYIDPDFLKGIKYLKTANFSHNQLTLDQINELKPSFLDSDKISKLDLSYNNIQKFYLDWSHNNNLKLLNLSHNNITNVKSLRHLKTTNEITIDLRYNKIKEIPFEDTKISTHEPNVYVYIEHNPFFCDCNFFNNILVYNEVIFEKLYRDVTYIQDELSCIHPDGTGETKIKQFNPVTYQCYEHDFFDIEPKCQNNCICWVKPKNKIRIIDCSYKKMSKFSFDENKVNFAANTSIILNLTGNALTEIPSIKPLKSMSVTGLLLPYNNISQITADKLLKTLKILKLHNNSISAIEAEEINALSLITFEEITLSGNPFECSCKNVELLNYAKKWKSLHKDLSKLIFCNLTIHTLTDENICLINLVVSFYGVLIIMFVIIASIFSIWYIKKEISNLLQIWPTPAASEHVVHYRRPQE